MMKLILLILDGSFALELFEWWINADKQDPILYKEGSRLRLLLGDVLLPLNFAWAGYSEDIFTQKFIEYVKRSFDSYLE